MNTFSNRDNIIDSHDIIARIGELESLRDDWQEDHELPEYQSEGADYGTDEAGDLWQKWEDSDDGQELAILLNVQEQAEGYGDWKYGGALIRDSYFKDYAQELAEDIGAINRDATWPNNCIDWDEAAEELQMNYTSVDFDGVDYWIRS